MDLIAAMTDDANEARDPLAQMQADVDAMREDVKAIQRYLEWAVGACMGTLVLLAIAAIIAVAR